jgi:hypothetical protein
MLFFREAQALERAARAARIVDTNAATQAKDGGKSLVRELKAED